MFDEANYIYQCNVEKAMKKVERAQNQLRGIQYGVGSLGEGEYYDPQNGVIVKQMNRNITTKVCETMIAQFLSGYRIPIAQIPTFIANNGLTFKRIDEITFNLNVGGHGYDIRHACDAGITFGTYIDVPLITRDLVPVNNMNVIYEYRYDSTYAKLRMYVCELCGTVLYNFSE